MQFEMYPFKKIKGCHYYEFYSAGPKGKVRKMVCIKCTDWHIVPIFNLGFGDLKGKGKINDLVVTNNQDGRKVLSTVVAALLNFIEDRPGSWVHAKCSTPSRTRMYQMGINLVFDEIKNNLTVYGEIKGRWEKFSKGKNYESFLLKSKKS